MENLCIPVDPETFEKILTRQITFQLIKSFETYQPGDIFYFYEVNGLPTGRDIKAKVYYFQNQDSCEGLKDDYCIIGFKCYSKITIPEFTC